MTDGDIRYFKVLFADGRPYHGGRGQWSLPDGDRAGQWMPPVSDPVPCARGYHVVAARHLLRWLGPAVFEVEVAGAIVHGGHKVAVERARLLRRLPWDDRTILAFSLDCAERVLPVFEEEHPKDDRPRRTLVAARAWIRGDADPDMAATLRMARRAAEDSRGSALPTPPWGWTWAALGGPEARTAAAWAASSSVASAILLTAWVCGPSRRKLAYDSPARLAAESAMKAREAVSRASLSAAEGLVSERKAQTAILLRYLGVDADEP